MAHDLQGPLFSIRVSLELLEKIKSNCPENDEAMEILSLSTKRLFELSERFLREIKGHEEESAFFDVHAILDELVREFAPTSTLSHIRFEKKYETQPVVLFGKPTRLKQAFANLLKNAREAMDGCGIIEVITYILDDHVIIKIRDHGTGMTEEQVKKIFAGKYSTKANGHGIGLSVVKDVVEEFSGKIKVTSQKEQGSCFAMHLPQQTHTNPTDEFMQKLSR